MICTRYTGSVSKKGSQLSITSCFICRFPVLPVLVVCFRLYVVRVPRTWYPRAESCTGVEMFQEVPEYRLNCLISEYRTQDHFD